MKTLILINFVAEMKETVIVCEKYSTPEFINSQKAKATDPRKILPAGRVADAK